MPDKSGLFWYWPDLDTQDLKLRRLAIVLVACSLVLFAGMLLLVLVKVN
jgi:hypothetical protein